MHTKKARIAIHLKKHSLIYLFTTILFLTGVVFGAVIVNSMSFVQKQDLFFYLERFFGALVKGDEMKQTDILQSSFLYHAKYLIIMFLLGLSVIGLPLVWIFLFLKGLVVGFSVGFLVNQLGFNGLILATMSIAPQNLLIIPIYIIGGSFSMIFSLVLLSKLFGKRTAGPVSEPFLRYLSMFAVLLAFSFVAALLEAFVAKEAMELIIKSFYK